MPMRAVAAILGLSLGEDRTVRAVAGAIPVQLAPDGTPMPTQLAPNGGRREAP